MLVALLLLAPSPDPVTVSRDDTVITESCTVAFAEAPVPDADGDGVVHIATPGITVEFTGTLRGAAAGTPPDGYAGTGIRVTAGGVTLRGARVGGFKAGIHATGAGGLVVEDCDVSDNFRQRLGSTPQVEDSSDWLRPHANDGNEWLEHYGAGLYVEESADVTIRRVRAREVQNGIVLDRVEGSRVYDNDCSFLSGWGLAMWRSGGNLVSRNAFDFCVRGYSHGVYNRGQDSAGILMFEQCADNVIAENSATHGGDGLFAFAGSEALGETGPPRESRRWHRRRGNNDNLFYGNDFSDAAAHGLELTFSFGNMIARNRFAGNAICGIWGGYSQDTLITDNDFEANGEMGYGAERGGINIEHGRGNRIMANRFAGNACGVFLWWDPDPHLMKTPWAKENDPHSTGNLVVMNTFHGDRIAVQLRETTKTTVVNASENVAVMLDMDEPSRQSTRTPRGWWGSAPHVEAPEALGETRPVGARDHLRGRDRIIMTKWGPYDWQAPYLHAAERAPDMAVYELLGAGDPAITGVSVEGDVTRAVEGRRMTVRPTATGAVLPYEITVTAGGETLTRSGVFVNCAWDVRAFAYRIDPREHVDVWRSQAAEHGATTALPALDLRYANGGPSDLDVNAFRDAELPRDRFGTFARTRVTFPAGRWRIRTISDDGIRVWLNDRLIIDDWTWHAPTEHVHEVELPEPTEVELRVEHFELDGYAILTLHVEAVP